MSGEHRNAIDELWRAFRQTEPRTEREKAYYAQSLTQLTIVSDAREPRLFESGDAIPPLLWGVLCLGGTITIAFSFLFGVRSVYSQAAITMALTTSIALVLFLVVAINFPFRGSVRVQSTAFERSVTVIAAELGLGSGRRRR